MSFDDLHSSKSVNEQLIGIQYDVKMVASFLPENEEITVDDTELLARLDSAHSVAGGVEARLDDILGTLDDLLTSLEPKDADNTQETASATPSETQFMKA